MWYTFSSQTREVLMKSRKTYFTTGEFAKIFDVKNFDYPEKPLKYKHIRRISD